jgi:hypothetical protein
MGNKRKYTFLEFINAIYFIFVLFILACKFGIIFKDASISLKIFEIFYYKISIAVLLVALIIVLILIIKSKKIKNSDESTDCSKNIIAVINILVISFQFIFSLFGALSNENVAFEWLQLIIYISIVVEIIDFVVYSYVRTKILENFSRYNQTTIVNRYIFYAVTISFVLGIIIPNLMLHYGIVRATIG